MLGLVLATSNVPYLYRPLSDWQKIYEQHTNDRVPPPNELAQETDEIAGSYVARIDKAFDTLRGQIESYRPQVIVVLGYDDGTCFSGVQVPQFCTYVGGELKGTTAVAELGEKPEEHMIEIACNSEFAWEVHRELVDREFDMSYMSIQNPLGKPENGTTSAFTWPVARLLKGLDIPIVPMFINCLVEPTPSGHRCYLFGRYLGEVLDASPARVAILAVGGLSHDPGGDRAGWIDNRMDQWVLDNLAKGDANRLRTIFDVDSDTIRGGSGEIRNWIAAGAAAETKMGKATVVDYVPALRTMTGLGFSYWQLPESIPMEDRIISRIQTLITRK